MFIVDKYRPKTYEDTFFHKNIISQLKKISEDDSIPNLIFHGPNGSGKHTIIRLFLQMLYGVNINRVHDTLYKVSGSNNALTDVIIKQSKHHTIVQPIGTNFDRYLIHDVVKDYAKRVPLNINFDKKKNFKMVFINNIDMMSYYAQMSLRRTMELYSKNCRFIMLSTSLSKVIDPLVSRCLCFRIPSPRDSEIFSRVCSISAQENIIIDIKKFSELLDNANGNIKKALWTIDMMKYNLDYKTTYTYAINSIVNLILEYGVDSILGVRKILYDIIITNINGTYIIKNILEKFIKRTDITSFNKYKIVAAASKYEYNLIKGRREIIHLEAFIQSIIAILYENKIK